MAAIPQPIRKPRALQPGDEVRIISPASALTHEQTEDGIRLLESWGLKVTFGRHVYGRFGYLAAPDEDRAADLMDAVRDPGVAAIMCSRGGYGCARLLPHISMEEIAASGKMLCGFSDITTLHVALNRLGLATWHTPMLITLSVERQPWVIESLRRSLFGQDPIMPEAPRAETVVGGIAEGPLIGGCLCLLCDTVNTAYPLETEGCIFLIEDVDENPHRVDAMFTHLLNTGLLQRSAGVVIGEMTGTDERRDEKIGAWPWKEIVLDRLKGIEAPAVINYPFGHMKTMMSLPLGIRARLDADSGRLSLLEAPCAG